MKQINNVAVIGAGALGLLFAAPITRRLGSSCFFAADRERAERLEQTAFSINSSRMDFTIKTAGMIKSPPDLLIVAVKNHHLEDIVPLLQYFTGKETIIISVLNGIDSETFLEQHCPDSKIIYSVAVGMDAVHREGSLVYSNPGKLIIGTKSNNRNDAELRLLAAFLEKCGINSEIPDDIHRALWWKWMINIGVNQVSAVTGANYGVFHTNSDIQKLMDSAMFETVRVAEAAGVDLRDEDVPEWYPILNSLGADNKTSMLQDIEAGRRTEADWFSGRLVSLARQYGLTVPVNETLYRILKTREAMFL